MSTEKIIGSKIVEFRGMTEDELDTEGWEDSEGTAFVLVLDNGLKCYASMDDEGNGPGTLFWHDGKRALMLMPTEVEGTG